MALSQRDILVTPIPGLLIDTTVVSAVLADGTVFSTTGHGLIVGDIVRVDPLSSSGLTKADKSLGRAGQFMVSEILDANNVRLAASGDAVVVGGFSDGDLIYVGNVGAATNTEPNISGEFNQFVGQYKGGKIYLNFTIAITIT